MFRRLRRVLPMHRIASLAAKLALLTAAGAGLYLSSHYTDDRKVSNWTTSVASTPEATDKNGAWYEPFPAAPDGRTELV